MDGLQPQLENELYVFCTDTDGRIEVLADVVGFFREAEGMSFILPISKVAKHGFSIEMPMRKITLGIYSTLDGVGLTAAVSTLQNYFHSS